MENRKVFNSAKQGNNEKYCCKKESQGYTKNRRIQPAYRDK